jgi:type IV pilus biogenesis protein CpaD/CtpE
MTQDLLLSRSGCSYPKIVAAPTNNPSDLRHGLTPRNNSSHDHNNHNALLTIKTP